MELSRRTLLGGFAAVAGGSLVGCSSGMNSTGTPAKKNAATELTMWCWPGGLGKSVLDDTITHFPDPKIKYSEIGGDFKQKLITTFNGGTSIPDITGLKGEDIASLLPQAERFVDLKTVGADSILGDYLEWKVKQATTLGRQGHRSADRRRPDRAVLPRGRLRRGRAAERPREGGRAAEDLGRLLRSRCPAEGEVNPKALLVWDATDLYGMVIGQGTERYISKDNKFIGDQDHIRKAWDTSVKAMTMKIDGKTPAAPRTGTPASTRARCPPSLGAAWVALDIKSA